MRVQGYKTDDWALYEFRTTYRMGWHNLIFFVKAIWPHIINPEILVSANVGQEFKPVEIKEEEELISIPEGGAIEIRGRNKIYDDIPFQFEAFNQTDLVRMFVPTQYLNSLKKSETEFLDDNDKLHTFDKFMDSIEVNSASLWAEYDTAMNVMDAMTQALVMKENFLEERIYRCQKANNYGKNLTKICNKIVENWKELNSHPKTGGSEAATNAINALKAKEEREEEYGQSPNG